MDAGQRPARRRPLGHLIVALVAVWLLVGLFALGAVAVGAPGWLVAVIAVVGPMTLAVVAGFVVLVGALLERRRRPGGISGPP